MRTILILSVALGVAACATVDVKGVKVDEGTWKKDTAEIGRRFAFEMHCNDSLDFTILEAGGRPTAAGGGA
jgi:hypothetical protein